MTKEIFDETHSVVISKFFLHEFLQKFRQSNFFTKELELYCKSIWRKIFQVRENLRNYVQTTLWDTCTPVHTCGSFANFPPFFKSSVKLFSLYCPKRMATLWNEKLTKFLFRGRIAEEGYVESLNSLMFRVRVISTF